jgi:uncharacterized protein
VRIYCDSSALVKRALDEEHSDALRDAIDAFHDDEATVCSSSLAWIEVSRGLRSRLDAQNPALVVSLIDLALSGVEQAPITAPVIGSARRIGSPFMRSLDAIHLATASLLDVELVVAYDERLLTIAAEFGFRTSSPGMD